MPAFSIDRPAIAPGEVIRLGWGGASLSMNGWVFDHALGEADSPVEIEFVQAQTNRVLRVPAIRCARSDVAVYHGNPKLSGSGFYADISCRGWLPGVYSANLALVRDGSAFQRAAGVLTLELTLYEFELSARAGLAAKFLQGSGIEIGALQRPLPVPASCSVRYIDRMPFEQLLAHYPELEGLPVQAPDLIDDGELLVHVADRSQDFVIANHFFEHSRNPIRTLLNFARVLAPGGVLFMAVPDKRYTRDVLRPETEYSELLEAFRTGRRQETGRMYREWAENWEGARGESIEVRAKDLEATDYSIHYNVWSLSGLFDFLLGAKRDAGAPFEITSAVCAENEAILILTRLA